MQLLLIIMALSSLVGCTAKTNTNQTYHINKEHPSATYDSRVQFLILHYTAVDEAESFRLLTSADWPASAHYLVTEHPQLKGGLPTVYQMVAESERSWHAGTSRWGTVTSLNYGSIGIEMVGFGYVDKDDTEHQGWLSEGEHRFEAEDRYWFYYSDAQIEAVIALAKDIVERHGIEPQQVLAHSDIAPTRKSDPGPLFPWKQLYDAGVGAWYEDATFEQYLQERELQQPADTRRLLAALGAYGYPIPTPIDSRIAQVSSQEQASYDHEVQQVIRAFQMHFRPTDFAGVADAESEAIAFALLERYRGIDAVIDLEETLKT
jgi:N-acetylmuramoyl-L-alanine amidase